MSTDSSLAEELRARYLRWFAAIADRDVDHLDREMDDRWEYTDSAGLVHSKASYLDAVRTAPLDFTLELVAFRVVDLHDAAVVRAVWLTRAERLQPPTSVCSTTNHTGVWRRDGSRWRSLVHHVTTVNDSALRSGLPVG
jgi:ketosteroid isomerase-like protein